MPKVQQKLNNFHLSPRKAIFHNNMILNNKDMKALMKILKNSIRKKLKKKESKLQIKLKEEKKGSL